MRTDRWMIYKIRAANRKAGEDFFNQETMRFFDWRMNDFQVLHVETPNGIRTFLWTIRGKYGTAYEIFEFLPSGRIGDASIRGYDFRLSVERERFVKAVVSLAEKS